MDRFFAAPESWRDDLVALGPDEAHHCTRVMRKAAGDVIEIFDGAGRWARGTIAEAGDGEVTITPREEGRDARPRPALTLAVAIPKGKTMELIVQKAVELGVASIQPLVTEHTVVRLDNRDGGKKQGKWQRVALEACKQCGQNYLPVVAPPCALAEWLAARDRHRFGLVGSLGPGARGLRAVLTKVAGPPPEVDVLIGPEGDFSEAEHRAADAEDFRPVSLGALVLRVETAVLFVLSALRYQFSDDGRDA